MLNLLRGLFGTLRGNIALFAIVLCAVVAFLGWNESAVPEAEMTKIEYGGKEYKPVQISRNNSPYQEIYRRNTESRLTQRGKAKVASRHEDPRFSTENKERKTISPLTLLIDGGKKLVEPVQMISSDPKRPKILPLDIFTGSQEGTPLSQHYAPYGRMVPCETVITIDSSKMNTPVLALVTEDVYHDGKLIIPAGAEVHGKASPDKTRERVDASGSWVIVWRDGTALNGSEMQLSGIALDRSIDFNRNKWGIDDGSAGLKGNLIKSSSWAEARLFASEFLSAMAHGSQEKRLASTGMGEAQLVPKDTMTNAALQGSQAVIDRYAQKILEEIDDKGFYVRVPAGTQFYLYVTQTIDITKGKRGNLVNGADEIWKNETE